MTAVLIDVGAVPIRLTWPARAECSWRHDYEAAPISLVGIHELRICGAGHARAQNLRIVSKYPMSGEILAGLVILVGIAGTVIPLLPGVMLVGATVGIWAIANDAWWLLGIAILFTGVALLAKFLLPARAVQDQASIAALAVGSVLAVVGFFMIPVIGLPVGFVAGVFLAEAIRLQQLASAWTATVATLKSIGVSMIVEFGAASAMAIAWGAAVTIR